jgi:DNA-binding NarL/FixJ family response regulator
VPAIRVSIIEDRREIREGLGALLDATSGYRFVSGFGSMEDALAGLGADVPDVALVDLGLPGMSGIQGLKLLKERWPALPLVVLTVYDDDERIFDALCAGACGYLLKKTPPLRLLEALKDAVDGGSPISPEVASRVLKLFRDVAKPASQDHDLTPHELRLLKMLVEGHNYKTAADELGVSVNTVSFHVRHIYEKLHVHSKSEAVSKALRDRLVV